MSLGTFVRHQNGQPFIKQICTYNNIKPPSPFKTIILTFLLAEKNERK